MNTDLLYSPSLKRFLLLPEDVRSAIRDYLIEPTQSSNLITAFKKTCVFTSEIFFQEFAPGFYRDWKLHEMFNKTQHCRDCDKILAIGQIRWTNIRHQPKIYCYHCWGDYTTW